VVFYSPQMLPVFSLFADTRDTAYRGSADCSGDVASSDEAQAWENWLYALPGVAAVADVLAATARRGTRSFSPHVEREHPQRPPAPAPQQPPSPSAAAVRATPVERAALCPSLANEPGKKRCGK